MKKLAVLLHPSSKQSKNGMEKMASFKPLQKYEALSDISSKFCVLGPTNYMTLQARGERLYVHSQETR